MNWSRLLPIAVGLWVLSQARPVCAAPSGNVTQSTEEAASAPAPAADAPAEEAEDLEATKPAPTEVTEPGAAPDESGVPASASGDGEPPAALPGEPQTSPAPAMAPSPTPLPPPKGDRLQRLGMAGGLMLGKVYMLTITIATGALVLCWADPHDSICLLPDTRAAWYDLYIPVAGPFVAFRHEDVRDKLGYLLSFGALGTAQSVGLVLVSAALLTWPDEDEAGFMVTPQLMRDGQGLSVVGRF